MKIRATMAALVLVLATGAIAETTPTPAPAPAAAPRTMMLPVAMALEPLSIRTIESLGATIGLTADQKRKLTDLMTQAQNSLEPLRAAYMETVAESRKAVYAGDAAAIKEAIAKARKAEDAVIELQLATWDQIRPILTPDQLDKLKSILALRTSRPTSTPPPSTTDDKVVYPK